MSKLLDFCSGLRDEISIFSNHELAGLIKYHVRSENHGGSLEQDTVRVMLGALSLDGHTIGANFSPFPHIHFPTGSNEKDSDVEKADLVVVHGMIVNWSAVKTVDIDEPVDRAFIKKVKSWSYSRIPVIGEAQVEETESGKSPLPHWNAKKVFGVLHIKVCMGSNPLSD
jgi:metal transporter CNNM